MSDHIPARPWQRLRRALARIVAPLAARTRRTLPISLPDAAAPPHPTGDTTMTTPAPRPPATPDPMIAAGRAPTSNRHTRHADDDWRAAATRAAREGRKVSDVVRELVAAYGAGTLDLPDTRPHPDAWACLACRSEEARRAAGWLTAPCPAHQPTTTPTPTRTDA